MTIPMSASASLSAPAFAPVSPPTPLPVPASTPATGTAPVPPGNDHVELSYDATVPRALVHRASIAEVFVTDSAGTGEDTFVVAAQLPRGHLIGENSPLYDFSLMVEVVRQAGVLIAHRHLEVQLDSAFIFRDLTLRTTAFEPLRIGRRPASARITVSVRTRRNKAGRLQGFSFLGDIEVDGRSAMKGEGGLLILSKAAYQAMRSRRLSPEHPGFLLPRFTAAEPSHVGRRDARNVFITEPVADAGQFACQLVVDTSHPHVFDHPLDHVPGHLQMEAARQLAVAAVARLHALDPYSLLVASIATEFTDYAELDRITRLRATVDGFRWDEDLGTFTTPVVVEAVQEDTITTAMRLEVSQWV
ncbi:secondary metabolite corepressor [Streptomyces sp. KM273126]|uniref:ScbA/BarX family gamma-butyrolactone biosynthesis protein n=1 Tax=Streptomyces sp. KM273126 TaxID=2545247 RepID=UPI0015EC3836|nr:ScbA/BarX family gamma-butyrolactone biosynthesis protein [Streptomyces sp. KM273126]MBA2806239.1 secondary metabolite corepressor [Streptomyces sp. KM273126]